MYKCAKLKTNISRLLEQTVCSDDDDDDEFVINTKLHGCLSNEEEGTTLWYVHACQVQKIILLYLQLTPPPKKTQKTQLSSILHAKVMLLPSAWRVAAQCSLGNYNTFCYKRLAAELNNDQIQF